MVSVTVGNSLTRDLSSATQKTRRAPYFSQYHDSLKGNPKRQKTEKARQGSSSQTDAGRGDPKTVESKPGYERQRSDKTAFGGQKGHRPGEGGDKEVVDIVNAPNFFGVLKAGKTG